MVRCMNKMFKIAMLIAVIADIVATHYIQNDTISKVTTIIVAIGFVVMILNSNNDK